MADIFVLQKQIEQQEQKIAELEDTLTEKIAELEDDLTATRIEAGLIRHPADRG